MHEAVHKGNQPALKRLVDYTNAQLQSARGLNVAHKYKGKLGLWAETQSGHLPIHVVFRRNAPVYHSRAQIVPWLLQLMDEQLGHIRAAASTSCISAEAVHPQGEPLQLPESTLQALSMSMPAGFIAIAKRTMWTSAPSLRLSTDQHQAPLRIELRSRESGAQCTTSQAAG